MVNNQTRYKANPKVMTSVTISPEFYQECKKHDIGFSEAMRVGISVLLAEKGVAEYDNKLNIVRKRDALISTIDSLTNQKEQLDHRSELKSGEVRPMAKTDIGY
jgi:hypothetical protein